LQDLEPATLSANEFDPRRFEPLGIVGCVEGSFGGDCQFVETL
jgi:hypothetical protein